MDALRSLDGPFGAFILDYTLVPEPGAGFRTAVASSSPHSETPSSSPDASTMKSHGISEEQKRGAGSCIWLRLPPRLPIHIWPNEVDPRQPGLSGMKVAGMTSMTSGRISSPPDLTLARGSSKPAMHKHD